MSISRDEALVPVMAVSRLSLNSSERKQSPAMEPGCDGAGRPQKRGRCGWVKK